jgi:PAS domain S-box-containing protein
LSAPRGRTSPGPAAVLRTSPAGPERPHDAVDPGALQRLAQRWAQAAARLATAAVEHRLATILRRLAGVLRAEPFEPSAAQELGAAVVESGLCGEPPASHVLATSLELLRTAAPAALGVPGVDGARRTAAALDHLAAGFAAALADAARAAPEVAAPVAAIGSAGTDLRLTMADDAPVGVAVMALDGRVLTANPELTAFLDLGDLMAEPRPFTDFVHADDLPEVLERYTRLLRGEPDTQRMDLRVVRPDGVILWVRIVARLGHTDGVP